MIFNAYNLLNFDQQTKGYAQKKKKNQIAAGIIWSS